jgi:ankyrin repeat protein
VNVVYSLILILALRSREVRKQKTTNRWSELCFIHALHIVPSISRSFIYMYVNSLILGEFQRGLDNPYHFKWTQRLPCSSQQHWQWRSCNEELKTNLAASKGWKNLDIDENYVDWKTSWGKFEEIEAVVLAATAGKNKAPQYSWTLLHWAAHCNKTWPISQFLLDTEHVDVMTLDSEGRTALDIALACNPPSTAAAEMLQAHITKNKLVAKKPATQSSQSVPLPAEKSTDAVSSSQQVSKALADAKAAAVLAEKQAAEQELKNETPNLFKAILAKDISGVNLALTQGADIYGQDNEEFFPILRAAQVGDVDILKLLISKGADANTSHSITNHSALYEAALNNQKAAVLFLLEQGAEPDFVNFADETPMHACARSGAIEIAQALQLRGVDLDARNEKNQTPLILAVLGGNKTNKANIVFVKWLLEQKVQWDVIDSDGKTALDYSKGADKGAAYNELSKLKKQGGYKSSESSDKSPSILEKNITPPASSTPKASTPEAALSPSSSSQTKSLLDDTGGIRVQFIIPSSALTIYKSEILGSGGFGIVYKGLFNFSEVAIKKLHADNLSERALEEFKSESLLMGHMRHPNVIQPLGACFEPGQYSLVMELMPNKSLFDLLHNKKEIPWTIRAQIAADVCAGLAYLHSQKIIHRDLKSMNVLLDGGLRAKLSDFGLATVKIETQSTTPAGAKAAGTTRWMAPELFEGDECTFESDIYSLAWVLWEIAARQLPYPKAVNDAIVINLIGKGKKEPIPADCPPEIGQAITGCWKTIPSERPSSAETSTTITAWCSLFKTESQTKAGVSTRTEMRQGFEKLQDGQAAIQQKQEEIAAGVKLGINLQIPPIPQLSSSSLKL